MTPGTNNIVRFIQQDLATVGTEWTLVNGAIGDGVSMSLMVCRVGNAMTRGNWTDMLCLLRHAGEGGRSIGYYRVGGSGGNFTGAHLAPPYGESYNPLRTLEEYESNLHFNNIARLWRIDGTPRPL